MTRAIATDEAPAAIGTPAVKVDPALQPPPPERRG